MNPDPQSNTLGEFLEFRRRLLGKDQREFAELVGVTQSAVSKWERDTSIPEPARLRALAVLFGIDHEVLVRKAIEAEARRAVA